MPPPALVLVQCPQPWRLTAFFDAYNSSQLDVSTYSLMRGGVVSHPILSVWQRLGAPAVELALDAPLLDGEVYQLSQGGGSSSVAVAWHVPQVSPAGSVLPATLSGEVPDDPEAEAFGVDVDWVAQELTGSGDLPAARGLAALKHDLAALAVTSKGELMHRPLAGLGLRERVNGAGDGQVDEMQAEARAAFLADDRVSEVSVTITRDGERTALRTNIKTPTLASETVDFSMRL